MWIENVLKYWRQSNMKVLIIIDMLNGFCRKGYRYQPEENGFMCEFSLVPIIVKGVFVPSFGFSFGYGFK